MRAASEDVTCGSWFYISRMHARDCSRVYVCCVIFLVLPHGFSSKLETIRSLHPCGRHGGLMVSTQASGSSGPSLYPRFETLCCVLGARHSTVTVPLSIQVCK